MANYKRKRPRTRTNTKLYDKWRAKKREARGEYFWWMNTYPRWWDVVFHTRPRRRRTVEIMKAVMHGKIEADEAPWPLNHKPHIYFW